MGGIQDDTTQRIKTQDPMQPRCECGGGGEGEGTLIFQFIRRLGPFWGVQIFEILAVPNPILYYASHTRLLFHCLQCSQSPSSRDTLYYHVKQDLNMQSHVKRRCERKQSDRQLTP